jgi:hypothetical protein
MDESNFNIAFVYREPCDRCGEERICLAVEIEKETHEMITILCENCVQEGFKRAKTHYRNTVEM